MLKVYTIEESQKWDEIVRTFTEYDVYWLSGYVKAFQIHGDGVPLLFYYEDESTRGINVVMKRDIADDARFKGKTEPGKYFDFATPYGYGGWLIEGENTDGLFREYEAWIKNHQIISEFVRFHPMIKNHEANDCFYKVIQLGKVVHMDLESPETIWANIISKNRNMIRKAQNNGIKIYYGRYPEIYEKFREVYNGTMGDDEAEEYYFFSPEFYQSVLNDLPYNAQVFWAEQNGKVIAVAIMLTANGRMNYHLSGSLREYRSMAPSNLLLYEAALWGNANGCKTLYLGGGVGSSEDGLFKFKQAFYRGDLGHFYIGQKIYDAEKYDELVNARTDIENPRFFPQYRG